jgi:hypothetical protein
MSLGRPLGSKLFLEGKEVPLIGATMNFSENQASIAYIDLVPHEAINHIKPRTHVEIAVRDYNNIEDNFPFVTAWEGEVFGFSFSKEVNGRTFSVSAIDMTSYWDNVLSYFMNTNASLGAGGIIKGPMGVDYQTAQAQGYRINATIGGADVSFFAQTINNTLKDKSKDFLDALFAVYVQISDINDFYTAGEKKLRIRDRVVLKSSGALQKLVNVSDAKKWFSGIIDQSGGFTSLRQVIQNLLGIIFHSFVPMPFPARVARANMEGASLPGIDNVKRTIGSYVLKPSLYMIAPPMCNIFFPDEYSQFSFNRNFFNEPTRLIYQPVMAVFGAGQPDVILSYVYEPPSFNNFMQRQDDWKPFIGTGDMDVSSDQGYWAGTVLSTDATARFNGGRLRESQFLTNEEKLKGIFMASEKMLPLNNEFQGSDLTEISKQDFCQKVAKYLFYKKRFENRTLQITSHLKLSVVPGFPVLILDDSDAKQNVVAYCTSVSHRIYATQGGYTNVTLTYARTVDEQQQSTSASGEPLVPAFYASEVFGTSGVSPVKSAGKSKLSLFYSALLGDKGSKPVTDYVKTQGTLSGAVDALLVDYRKKKESGAEDVQSFIASLTGRDYVRLRDSMGFKGATTETKDLRTENWTDFTGGAFNPIDQVFGATVTARLVPINKYREALKSQRGFRG